MCDAEGTCNSPSKASAMLQVSTKAHTYGDMESKPKDVALGDATESKDTDLGTELMDAHLEEARACLPDGLPGRHLSALRRHATRLAARARPKAKVKSHHLSEGGEAAWDGDTSLPLRTDDVVYLKNLKHGTRLGWWGMDGVDFTAACPLSGLVSGIQAFENTPERAQITIEVVGADTYLKQVGHGSYAGICNDASGSCGADTGLANVNGFSSKVDATKFAVEESGGNVYLLATFADKYLSVACTWDGDGGAAHAVWGYPSKANSALLQQDEGQTVSRTLWTVEFISRATTATTTTTAVAEFDGSTATLDTEGFHAVTALCCPSETEIFFERLIVSMGLEVCSTPHVQGLMHWFSCVPDMDFQYLLDVINNGNPCKYWTPSDSACPTLTPECEGQWCR